MPPGGLSGEMKTHFLLPVPDSCFLNLELLEEDRRQQHPHPGLSPSKQLAISRDCDWPNKQQTEA